MFTQRVCAVASVALALLSAVLLLSAPPASAGTLDASWVAPTTNTDGSPLTDLGSYRVYYGTSSSPCPGSSFFTVASAITSPSANQTVSLRLSGLTPGTQYFVSVAALDTTGNQSPCSVAASAVARSDFAVSPTGSVNFGSVNIGSFAEQIYTVSNTAGGTVSGSASVSGNAPLPAQFTIVSGSPFSITGTGSTQVKVRFTPTTASTVSSTLSFTANGGTINGIVTGLGVGNTADTTKPTVAISSPSGLTYTTASSSMTLQGTAADNVGVTQVTWATDRGGVGTASGTTSWTASGIVLQSGSNVLTVTARDAAGNTGIATMTATYDNTSPSVSVTAPAAGATVAGTVTVTANASDNVGVAGVQFLLDGVALGAERTTAPFSLTWTTGSATNGGHTLSARARDAVGNTAVAGNVAVTVSNASTNSLPPPVPSPAPLPSPTGLVAAYAFNEGAGNVVADASGNGNTGTLASGVAWTSAGRFGRALVFNGASYVTIPSSTSLNLTKAMTLEAWIYPTAAPSKWSTVVMKEQPGEFVYTLYASSPAKRPNAYFNTSTTASSERGISGTWALPRYAWSHLTGTYDGATLKIYVNGALVRSQAVNGPIATSNSPLRIGGNSVWTEFFQGAIDEVRIYNRALSQSEIQTDMAAPVGGGPTITDNTPPAVAITSPGSGLNYYTASSTLTLGGTSADNVGVTQVTWNNNRGGAGTASGTTSWSAGITLQPGANVLTATARDAAGNTSAPAAVTVTLDATPPSTNLTSPVAGATVSGTIAVAATASDNIGVAGVQFLLDGGAIGAEQRSGPFSLAWSTGSIANGAHTFSARVRDAAGNTTLAPGVTVTVANVASTPPPPATSGLVAAYAFKEGAGTTVADLSGNNNTATIGSGVSWTTQGRFGSALVFNGGGIVTAPASASLNLTTAMTLEAWVYPTVTPSNWSTVVMKEQPGEFVYTLYAGGSADRPYVYFNTATDASGERGIVGPSALPLNTWSHLAGTYDGTTLRLYVNGVLASSQAYTGSILTSSGALRIGGNTVWSEYFAGRIDEVRVYNRALSQSEIQTDMNSPVGGP